MKIFAEQYKGVIPGVIKEFAPKAAALGISSRELTQEAQRALPEAAPSNSLVFKPNKLTLIAKLAVSKAIIRIIKERRVEGERQQQSKEAEGYGKEDNDEQEEDGTEESGSGGIEFQSALWVGLAAFVFAILGIVPLEEFLSALAGTVPALTGMGLACALPLGMCVVSAGDNSVLSFRRPKNYSAGFTVELKEGSLFKKFAESFYAKSGIPDKAAQRPGGKDAVVGHRKNRPHTFFFHDDMRAKTGYQPTGFFKGLYRNLV